jgi:hypothetical protein
LYRENVKVSTKTTIDSRNITFVLNDEIKSTETSADYVIKGKVTGADRLDDEAHLYVRRTSDVVTKEKDTSFRAKIELQNDKVAYAKVSGADVVLTDFTTSAFTVTPGAKKIQLYTGTITALQAVRLETLSGLIFSTGVNNVLDNLYVQIGSSIVAASSLASTGVDFDINVTINGTVPFVIY